MIALLRTTHYAPDCRCRAGSQLNDTVRSKLCAGVYPEADANCPQRVAGLVKVANLFDLSWFQSRAATRRAGAVEMVQNGGAANPELHRQVIDRYTRSRKTVVGSSTWLRTIVREKETNGLDTFLRKRLALRGMPQALRCLLKDRADHR